MSKSLKLMYAFIIIVGLFNPIVVAQNKNVNNQKTNSILGKWEGNLVVSKSKSIGILWRFETSDQNKLIGFMGPASKGVATLPMQNIVVTDSTINYTIHSEGSFSGKISTSGITGLWDSGSEKQLELYMSRTLTKEQLSKRSSKKQVNTNSNDIYQSIKSGDVAGVKSYLNKGNNINKIDSNGYSLLVYAIKKDKTYKVTNYLLAQGANPNLNINERSPLMYSVAYGNYPIIEALLSHKANVNYLSTEKESALLYAINGRDVKALQILLNHGANPDMIIYDQLSAIDIAKKENNKAILKVLNLPYEGVRDGPYIIKNDTKQTAVWVHKDVKYSKEIDVTISQIINHKGLSANLWGKKPIEVTKLDYKGDFKIAAVSDIHGQYDVFIDLLKKNSIIDQYSNWNFGTGHLVIAGDMFDRGAQVTEVLWFLYDLEMQASKKGGKLHVLLGNHDVMVLNGNLRAVHPKYLEISKILKQPFNSLFTEDTVLGDWLRTRPVLVKINNILFTHGGLHPDLAHKGLSIDQINSEFKKQLIASELPEKRNELGNYLHRGNGPIYYRGYFQGKTATTQQIEDLLNYFDITNIVVGHTTHRNIETRYDGKVIVIDANMKSGNDGEILFWESGEFVRGTLSGETLPIQKEAN